MLTDRQQQVLEAFQRLGSQRAVARELGLNRTTVQCIMATAARQGHSPALAPVAVPPGMAMTKTTVQYDAAGKVVQEWRRQAPEVDAIETVIKAMEERITGKAPKIRPPPKEKSDLMLEVVITDHHFGMFSWGKETGADYDCDIAARLLVEGVRALIHDSPHCRKIVIANLGDYFHSDNRQGTTEKSGHVLDTDSRFTKRIDAAVKALLDVIDLAATAADEVEVITVSGNHDWHSCKWLPRLLAAYYRNEKRITIRTGPEERQYLEHGKVLLGYTHGDNVKPQLLASNMPVEAPKAWARTQFRRWRTGHVHNQITKEFPGVVVETLGTLAAPDAYAHTMGLHAVRALTAFLWSAQWGLRARLERSAAELLALTKEKS